MSAREDVTEDRFLGGRVVLHQSAKVYRAGIDAVLLAASLDVRPGGQGVELGCGPGAALLCAALLQPDLHLTGVEADPQAAALARQNIVANGLGPRVGVVEADAFAWRPDAPVDAVFFNPPFFDDPRTLRAPAEAKRAAWLTAHALADWIGAGARMLKRGGSLTLVHRADRLGEALAGCAAAKLGSISVLPVQPRADRPAKRILVRAVKQGRAPLLLLPALVLHDEGPGQYAPFAEAVLRGEARLALTA